MLASTARPSKRHKSSATVGCAGRQHHLIILDSETKITSDCFIKYVKSKVLKRMESYRIKGDSDKQPRKLLLPVSGGVSYVVLLQILDAQLQRQLASRGRAAYDLHVVLVDTSLVAGNVSTAGKFQIIKDHFPSHKYSILSLESVFGQDKDIADALRKIGFHKAKTENSQTALKDLLTSATTPTSRSDLLEVLLLRIIVTSAKTHDCESILWAHSNSRLAAKALSDVAKGRGASLPSDIGDGPSPWGMNFNYPQRDLLKSELELYGSLLPEETSGLIIAESQQNGSFSIRNMSINDLLTNYINSQGEKYPSIMANVVRTASKLRASPLADTEEACLLCRMPTGVTNVGCSQSELCYGCLKVKSDFKP